MRIFLRIATALLAVYLLCVAGIYAMMCLPPARFAAGMAPLPGLVFAVLPFETLWFRARAGHLQVGDTAPDFDLTALDKKSRVTLSSFRGQKPVVLIFGSYS